MAQVRVMLSYDYNHFEIALGTEDYPDLSPDKLRKQAQRLADKAVRQFKVAKEEASKRLQFKYERECLKKEVDSIKDNVPESERTAEQKAKIKALEDYIYREQHEYDYDDDWIDSDNF